MSLLFTNPNQLVHSLPDSHHCLCLSSLSPYLTLSVINCRLKTHLLYKSFPPLSSWYLSTTFQSTRLWPDLLLPNQVCVLFLLYIIIIWLPVSTCARVIWLPISFLVHVKLSIILFCNQRIWLCFCNCQIVTSHMWWIIPMLAGCVLLSGEELVIK